LKDDALVKSLNVSSTVFQALQTGLVSYVELDSVLSLEDALDIIEVHQVAKENELRIKELQQELSGNG
jgi:c-di-GMP-related signal transduction protein